MGRLVTFKTGPFGSALHRSDYVEDGVPVVNPMQIIDGKIVPTSSMAITEEAARKLSDFRLQTGNIVIGRRGDMATLRVRTARAEWLVVWNRVYGDTDFSLVGRSHYPTATHPARQSSRK